MNPSFFTVSKLSWILLQPGHLLLLMVLLGWVLLQTRRVRLGRQLLGLVLLILLLLWGFSPGDALLQPLENRFPANPELPERVDGIIVLGGSVLPETSRHWQQIELNNAAERLGYFLMLARRYPRARLLFTGGSASLRQDQATEADQLTPLFQAADLAERVRLDNRARNTAENAREAKRLLQPRAGEHWVLVTTAFHMPRAVGVFCQQGWPVIPYPVDHRSLPGWWKRFHPALTNHFVKLETAVHEWLGLIAYRLSGRIPALLPDTCGPVTGHEP